LEIVGNLNVSGIVHCTWQGNLIGVKYGGTENDLSATGGAGYILTQPVLGGPIVSQPAAITPILDSIVILGPGSWSTNQAFRMVNGRAQYVTSQDSDPPSIDGVTLESGSEGDAVRAGRLFGAEFSTPLALPGVDGGNLWLPKTATALTAVQPSKVSGDDWQVYAGRRDNQYSLVLDPDRPIRLT
jgi:hypothetical protein